MANLGAKPPEVVLCHFPHFCFAYSASKNSLHRLTRDFFFKGISLNEAREICIARAVMERKGKAPKVPGRAKASSRFSFFPIGSDLTVTRLGEGREAKAEKGKAK